MSTRSLAIAGICLTGLAMYGLPMPGSSTTGWWTASTAVAQTTASPVWHIAKMTPAQSMPSSEADRRRESDKWLRLARLALNEGNTDAAQAYLEKAERIKASYDPADRKSDSPQSLRRDLMSARGPINQGPINQGQPLPSAPNSRPGGVNSPVDRFANDPAAGEPRRGAANGAPGELEPPVAVRRLPSTAGSNPANSAGMPRGDAKSEALRLTSLARAALDKGDLEQARRLAQQAQQIKVPESAYAPGDVRPWTVALEIDSAIQRRGGVVPASATEPAPDRKGFPVTQGLYVPDRDRSRVAPAANQEPTPAPRGAEGQDNPGLELYRQGLKALEQQDTPGAIQLFSDAWKFQAQFDPATRQQLRDKLTLLRTSSQANSGGQEPSALEVVESKQSIVRNKMFREVTSEQEAARKQSEADPKGALERLQGLRTRVDEADLDQNSRRQLGAIVDRSIADLQRYINQNKSQIELDERNAAIMKELNDDQEKDLDLQNQLAKLVEQFNKMIDERRYGDAEAIAKQANQLAPDHPNVKNMVLKASFAKQIASQEDIRRQSENGFVAALGNVDRASIPFDDDMPLQFNEKTWGPMSEKRKRWMEQQRNRMSPAEAKIRQKLREEKVEVNYTNQPLAEVIDSLTKLAQVNVHLDPQGLAAEGVSTDTPVTINLQEPIPLRSALELILEPLRLSYVIKHDVLQITSEQNRGAQTYNVTYYVADLVTPIPNFLPDFNVGLPNAIREAYRVLGYGGGGPSWSGGGIPMATSDSTVGATNKSVLSQMMGSRSAAGSMMPGAPQMGMSGPGGLGGAALADFDSLIDLITSTIEPDSWTDNGGAGAIEPFPTNLSLVISQTQEIHEQVADLLEQLRRLQDLQVTIEVRFITLRDDFWERLAVDFDFNIEDNTPRARVGADTGHSAIIGLDRTGNPTPNLDIQVNQNSFNTAIPPFGGFQPALATSLGFAILSDIEVFFVLEAASSDNRSNILQAPKVTLFNGQLATVFDGSTRPFVAGLIPVVGDFAAAHQPVIAVVHEGTSLSVQAVISADRRFVRLTLVPYFSQIRDVQEFTFTGRKSSDTGTTVTDAAGEPTTGRDNVANTSEGSTVQLPTVASTSVSTTVSVPDGGTVLLGGIKRLSEGRNEQGVPFLSKLPYINRLFRNIGIGRTTQSLMLMVTPRIIIQEEEEERLGIKLTP